MATVLIRFTENEVSLIEAYSKVKDISYEEALDLAHTLCFENDSGKDQISFNEMLSKSEFALIECFLEFNDDNIKRVKNIK